MSKDIKNLRGASGHQDMRDFIQSTADVIADSAAVIVVAIKPKDDGFTLDVRFWESLELDEANVAINPKNVLEVAKHAFEQRDNSHLN